MGNVNINKLFKLVISSVLLTSYLLTPISSVLAVNDTPSNGRYSNADPSGLVGVGEGLGQYTSTIEKPKVSPTQTVRVAALQNSCNCVVFRLDDIQDFWLNTVQVKVMDEFMIRNQKLSIGPVVNLFGADTTVVNKAVAGKNQGLFEVFIHGWDHNDHTTMTAEQQFTTLQQAQTKLQTIFGNNTNVFVPPYNAFNNDTLDALKDLGVNIMSTADYTDPHTPFVADGVSGIEDKDARGIYHLPETIGFVEYDDNDNAIRIPNAQILSEIDTSINAKGYAVLTIHSQGFATMVNGTATNSVDQTQFNDLKAIIDSVIAKNYTIKTFNEVVNYTPPTVAPTITFIANPNPILSGGSSTLTWNVTGTTPICTKSNGWTGSATTSGTQSVLPTTSTTYTLSCTNSAGTNTKSVNVNVVVKPTITLTVNPTAILSGQSSSLTWNVTGTSPICVKSNGWTGSASTSGTQSVSPITSTTYTIYCENTAGSDTKSVNVDIVVGPLINLTASPNPVLPGANSTLTWNVTGTTPTCTKSNGWTGSAAATGNQNVAPTAATTYTLTCSNSAGTNSKSVTIDMITAPVIELIASPATLVSGGSSVLTWNVTGATPTCTKSVGWTGNAAATGSEMVTPASITTYTMTCTNTAGSDTKSVTIPVSAPKRSGGGGGGSGGGSNKVLGATVSAFPDVDSKYTFHPYIKSLKDSKVVNGFDDGNYYPEQGLTRGQMAKFIVNAFKFEINSEGESFKDVDKVNHSLGKYIQTLKNLDIIDGYTDGTYKPNAVLKRGEATKFIVKALEKKGVAINTISPNKFSDIKDSDIFFQYISFLSNRKSKGTNENIIGGYPDGTYRSEEALSRGAMAKIVWNSMQSM